MRREPGPMLRSLLVVALLTLPAVADLGQAQRLLEQRRYEQGWREARRCRGEDPERAELLEIWGLAHDLREHEARSRLLALRPGQRWGRLYFLVRDQVLYQGDDQPERRRDLQRLLELSRTPAEKLDACLRLYSATPFPDDEKHWMAAARLAPEVKPEGELLGRLYLTHITLLKNRGRLEEAWLDLAQLESCLSSWPEGPAQVQLARAQILEGLGQVEPATQARWRAVELSRDELARLKVLRSLVERRYDLRPEQAQRALRILDAHPPGSDLRRAYALQIRSLILLDSNQGQASWSREVERLARHPDLRLRVLALSEWGRTLMQQGKKEGLTHLQQALELSRRLKPISGVLYRECQEGPLAHLVASRLLPAQRFGETEQLSRRALELASEGDFELRNRARLTLLQLYFKTAQIEAAEQVLREMFQEAERLDSPAVRVSIYVTVFNQMLMVDLHPVRLFSLSGFRMDPDSPSGWLFDKMRQDEELIQTILRALRNWRELARTPATRGSALLYEGMVLACLDRPLEAIDSYRSALEAARGVAFLEANIGLLLAAELVGQQRPSEALEVLTQARQRAEEAGPLAQPSRYQLALMGLFMALGRSSEALQIPPLPESHPDRFLDQFLRARAASDGEQLRHLLEQTQNAPLRDEVRFELARLQPDKAWLDSLEGSQPEVWLRRARLQRALGQVSQARGSCEKGLELLRSRLEKLPLATQGRAAASPRVQALLDECLQLYLLEEQPQQAARMMQKWSDLIRPSGATSPELERLRAELTGLEQGPASEGGERLADTRARFLAELNEVRRRHPDSERTLSAQGAELLELQPHLPESVLLVQYYVAPEGLYVQGLTRQQQVLRRVRVERARLSQLTQRWRSALQRPAPLSAEALEASHQLYSLLLSPLRDLLADRRELWLLPAGDLWNLPFETLKDENARYLAQSMAVSYLGPADLLPLTAPLRPNPGGWMALAQQQLPATARELQLLGEAFERPAGLSWEELRARAPDLEVLHLATHSQARPDHPNQASLQLGSSDIPLQQLYELRLRAGSLVVLNSCGGAQSQLEVERDPLSLASGFRGAGASSVVAALWPIDDEASAEFFPPMYRALGQGQSRSLSLWEARKQMLSSPRYSHPYYWGAYTLLGDPR